MLKIIITLMILTAGCKHTDSSKINNLDALRNSAPLTSVLGDEVPFGDHNILLIMGKPNAGIFSEPFNDKEYMTEFKETIFTRFLVDKSFYAAVYVDTSHFAGLPKKGAKNAIRKSADAEARAFFNAHSSSFPEGDAVIKSHLPIVHDPDGVMGKILNVNPEVGNAEFLILKKDGSIVKLQLSRKNGRMDARDSLTKLIELNNDTAAGT